MSEVCENFVLDIVEEEAFKNWLSTRGVTPASFIGRTDEEALAELSRLCEEFGSSGARELCHVAAEAAPEGSTPN